jgi:hypothetical protein
MEKTNFCPGSGTERAGGKRMMWLLGTPGNCIRTSVYGTRKPCTSPETTILIKDFRLGAEEDKEQGQEKQKELPTRNPATGAQPQKGKRYHENTQFKFLISYLEQVLEIQRGL